MAFTDLPSDARSLAVSDPAYTADFLDLVVPERDRDRGALGVLLCDDDDRLLIPMVVGDLPSDLPDEDRERTVAVLVEAAGGRGSVLIAVARRDDLDIRADDRAWRRAAERACAGGPRLLGVHVLTLDGAREVPAEAA